MLLGILPMAPVRVLDLACGQGRHSILLSQKGYHVTSVDRSRVLLQLANERPASHRLGLVECDVRSLPFPPSSFDVVINMWNSFGYFADDADNMVVLNEVALSLVPGGRLVMQLTHRDFYVQEMRPRTEWTDGNGTKVVVEESFNAVSGVRSVSRDERSLGGALRSGQFVQRCYTATELDMMMRRAMLHPIAWYGDLVGSPFSHRSAVLVAVAERSR